MYSTITELESAWKNVVNNTQDTLNWLKKNKDNQHLKTEYDSYEAGLSEHIDYAKRMCDNCKKVNSVGIFGESQAGKSFLVSTLISDKNGNSSIKFGNKTLDFIRDINPQGSGKESTGVVTRFSTHTPSHTNDNKFELVLLKELEIAKIIINSYYGDLKDAKAKLISQDDVNDVISKTANLKCGKNEFSSYDVVSLKKYVERNYKFLKDTVITDRYWQVAKNTVRKLSIENRAEYFSCLWNKKKIFTDLYIALARDLQKLNYAEKVLVNVEAIAPNINNNDKNFSIINVDALNGLLNRTLTNIPVVDVFAGDSKVQIPLSSITALTAELIIPISNHQDDFGVINKLDVLDFPGYRGRLNLRPDDLETDFEQGNEGCGFIKELFLRGKVSYLFERYTDLFEMNCLVVCTSSQSQINSVGMPEVITQWIYSTQGAEPLRRSNEKNGLFWAITQFDKKIDDFINNPNMNFGENGLLQQTILEKFGNCGWLKNWSDDQPFKNVYLVRKPRIKSSSIFLLGSDQNETKINPRELKNLEQMKRIFVNDQTVNMFIADPNKVWEEVLKPNDGGLKNLCENINKFPAESKRVEFMNAQLKDVTENIINRLAYFYTASDSYEVKRQKAKNIYAIRELLANRNINFVQQFGFFLDSFNLSSNAIIDAINSFDNDFDKIQENENDDISTESEEPFKFASGEDFGSFDFSSAFDDFDADKNQSENSLGKCIYTKWCEHVRALAEESQLLHYFGINSQHVTTLANEILDCSKAIKPSLCEILEENVSSIEKTENRKDVMLFPLSSSSSKIISEFVSTFGGQITELQSTNLDEDGLPKLDEKAKDQKMEYLKIWLQSMAKFASENLQSEAKFSAEENGKLGEILDRYKAIIE
ncbi:MAG: putative virulence factor [Succinivibrionaceae bacterium]|nr:putative virulence factor [Succinivibrionaceae bacterium]